MGARFHHERALFWGWGVDTEPDVRPAKNGRMSSCSPIVNPNENLIS